MSIKKPDFPIINSHTQQKGIVKGRHSNNENQRYIPEPYKNVAKGMESQFAEFMIQQMNKTTGGKQQSQAETYYKSLQDHERAKILASKNEGLGLQKLILDQIYPNHMRTKENYNRYLSDEKAKAERYAKNTAIQRQENEHESIEIHQNKNDFRNNKHLINKFESQSPKEVKNEQ